MFLEALPQIGSKESVLFILDLIRDNKVSDISAIQLLMRLPFHLRSPDILFLIPLQLLLELPSNISVEVQNTAILTFSTVVYKMYLIVGEHITLYDAVRHYFEKFTSTYI